MPYAPRITHVIAANLPAKIRHFISYSKLVCKSCIVDSVTAGRLLPVYQCSRLYTNCIIQYKLEHQLEDSEEAVGVSNDSTDLVFEFYLRLHYSICGNKLKQFTN